MPTYVYPALVGGYRWNASERVRREVRADFIGFTDLADHDGHVVTCAEFGEALFSELGAKCAFEAERFGNNTNSKCSHLFCNLCNNWTCTCTRSSSKSSCNKNHVCIF